MKVTYKGPGFTIDYDAATLKDVFSFLGSCDELFGAAECCENCKGTDLRPQYRKTKGGYEYYSIVCAKCRWEFRFGQTKDSGKLFPKGWEAGYQRELDQTPPRAELEKQSPF